MATAAAASEQNNDVKLQTRNTQWGTAVTGELADDFLRIEGGGGNMMVVNPAAYNAMFAGNQQSGGILNITVVQARLAKNYGMTRMDPYCRLQVGVQVFETPTSYNGSKTPRWNKLVQCHIPDTLKEFHIEIFDECSFSIDEKIAWGIKLTDEVFEGDTVENWHSLCGKQGDDKEGMIHIVLKYQKFEGQAFHMGGPAVIQNPMMVVNPMGAPMVVNSPIYGYSPFAHQAVITPQSVQPTPAPPPQTPQIQVNEADLKTLKEMCPSLDDDIILTVLHQSGGNIDRAAGQLLEMGAE